MNRFSPQSDNNYPFEIVGLRGTLRSHESLSKHTSWRVGGPADWFYEPAGVTDLGEFIQRVPAAMPLFWLGLGSNVLVRDGGIRGVVVLTAGLLNDLKQMDETTLWVEAGVSGPKVARFASKVGLKGVEFLAGIPGTFGGALAMNAGAFGSDTWSHVQTVEVLNRRGQQLQRSPADYMFGYRTVHGPPNEWFVAAILRLTPSRDAEQAKKISALLAKRKQTQPLGLPSCGSVFRNPPGDYAGRLIEQQGWKGRYLGGAYVSEKHANFIINGGHATATEIESLIEQIQASVFQATGIRLETEVCIIGEAIC